MIEAFKIYTDDSLKAIEKVKIYMDTFIDEFPHEIYDEGSTSPFLKLTKVICHSNPNGSTTEEILFPCADIKLISHGINPAMSIVYTKDGSSFIVMEDLLHNSETVDQKFNLKLKGNRTWKKLNNLYQSVKDNLVF